MFFLFDQCSFLQKCLRVALILLETQHITYVNNACAHHPTIQLFNLPYCMLNTCMFGHIPTSPHSTVSLLGLSLFLDTIFWTIESFSSKPVLLCLILLLAKHLTLHCLAAPGLISEFRSAREQPSLVYWLSLIVRRHVKSSFLSLFLFSKHILDMCIGCDSASIEISCCLLK